MMKHVLAGVLAVICAGALTAAQTPPPASGQPPATQAERPQTADQAGQTVTLVGCLYREQDIPGRTPNVAEKAGVLEDYILADASKKGDSPTGTSGTTAKPMADKHTMFKVEKIADEELRTLVGKRVEVIGRIDAEAGDKAQPTGTTGTPPADRSVGPDKIEIPEFEATSIKEVAGETCPAKPVR